MHEVISNRYVQAVVLALVAILLAAPVSRIITKVLARWAAKTKTLIDDELVAYLHRPILTSIVILGLALGTQRLPFTPHASRVTLGALDTIAIFVWLVFGFEAVELLRELFVERAHESPVPERALPLFSNLAKVVLIGAAVYLFFLIWDIDVTAWLASAGIIGIALGFAAKDTLANLFAGVFILVDAPYKLGDYIVLSSGERGQVTQIGIRSTRVLTRDDVEITIPNAVIGSAKITNESGGPSPKTRIRIALQVAYGSDVDRLREVLLDVAATTADVCAHPEPHSRFRSFGDSGLNFELLVWIDEPSRHGRIRDALNTAIYKRLAAEHIEIPYPVRDVRVRREVEPAEGAAADAGLEGDERPRRRRNVARPE